MHFSTLETRLLLLLSNKYPWRVRTNAKGRQTMALNGFQVGREPRKALVVERKTPLIETLHLLKTRNDRKVWRPSSWELFGRVSLLLLFLCTYQSYVVRGRWLDRIVHFTLLLLQNIGTISARDHNCSLAQLTAQNGREVGRGGTVFANDQTYFYHSFLQILQMETEGSHAYFKGFLFP